MPTPPPPCTRLGRQCREVSVTVRISDLDDDSLTLQDASATWMTGHTERVTWGDTYTRDRLLLVDATIHVPCRHLNGENGTSTCAAHGFSGRTPRSSQGPLPTLRFGNDTFSMVQGKRRRKLRLEWEDDEDENPNGRSLPVVTSENPCLTAQCRTSDNRVGAACCRDLTLEIELPETRKRDELLLRSRKPPYLCKFDREDEDTVECEVISACGYLSEDDGRSCTLHGRERPNGRQAKPSLCFDWPELDEDEAGHPGCVFT